MPKQGPRSSTVLYSTVQNYAVLYCTVLGLGPCFGMIGHFGRDPDVISRLPESTIDVLSVYNGFGSQCRVNMVVFDVCFSMIFIENVYRV